MKKLLLCLLLCGAANSQVTQIPGGLPSCEPYCSVEGGNQNSIAGKIILESANQGCDGNQIAGAGVKVGYNYRGEPRTSLTDAHGNYTLYAPAGIFDLAVQIENPAYWTVSPTAPVAFENSGGQTIVRNICIKPNGSHADVEVIIIPLEPAKPGFDADYQVAVRNKGNQAVSGTVNFSFDDSRLDFLWAQPAAGSQNAGSVSWNFTDLLPFATTSYRAVFKVNSPQEIPAVNIDDVLEFTAMASLTSIDKTPGDNVFGLNQLVVGSFDPNDKHCLQGSVVSTELIGEFLHYVINFENTGTAVAQKVVIKDQVDGDKFEISTFQVVAASHSNIQVVIGNKIEFYFQDINLAPGATGYVAFKIRTKNLLSPGTTVSNKASIYFDFNFPINTNTVHTTFQVLGIAENSPNQSVVLFPNPATNLVNVEAESQIQSLLIYDMQGRSVGRSSHSGNLALLDVSHLSPGIYNLEVVTQRGVKREKLIKQ